MAKFISFDGNRSFFNVDHIRSVTEDSSNWMLANLRTSACLVTFVDGQSIALEMSPVQVMALIKAAKE